MSLKWDFCYDLMLPKQGKRLLIHTQVISRYFKAQWQSPSTSIILN